MKVIVQRVKYAKCIIDNEVHSEIGQGFMLLVGVEEKDTEKEIEKVAKKVSGLRIFEDENDKMNLDLKTINGSILSISQFTLAADLKKGNRPSFVRAKKPEEANRLYEYFNTLLEKEGIEVKRGVFGAHMDIEMINHGPVTIIANSEEL